MRYSRFTAALTVAFPIGALIASVFIARAYYSNDRELRTAHRNRITQLEQNARTQLAELMASQRVELEQAFGDSMQSLTKNPEFTIAELLRNAAQASSPAGTRIEVRVDRFTEFDVDFQLPRKISDDEMARVTKTFLAECSAYVNSVRFIYNGQLIAEADKRKIDSIPDWRAVPLELLK